jgi:ABC-type branched-subunit amino acid transport system ATPase component
VTMNGPEAESLSGRLGGLLVVHQVSLSLEPGVLHAVIGSDGARKRSLVNLPSGRPRR